MPDIPLRLARFLLPAALLVALAGALAALPPEASNSQEPETGLAVDADPTGNTADSLGSLEACVSASEGDTFEIDITITDVTDLLAWEASLTYDPEIVEVLERDVEQFQAADGESTIFDVSQSTPDSDGTYGLGAVDTADPPALDSGSGVLARVTLEAKASGTSPLALPSLDLNEDTVPDRGPNLRDEEGVSIGDENSDGIFDGPVADAEVVVDGACSDADGSSDDDDDDGFPWVILVIILAAVGVAAAGGGFIAYRRTRRGQAGGP